MQHFDQRPHQDSTDPYLIVSLQRGYYVMCGVMVGCVVCEGYAFFIKNARLLNLLLKEFNETIRFCRTMN